MRRQTVLFVTKLVIVCVLLFLLFFWLSSLWSNWDYTVNVLWYSLFYGRKWRLYGG